MFRKLFYEKAKTNTEHFYIVRTFSFLTFQLIHKCMMRSRNHICNGEPTVVNRKVIFSLKVQGISFPTRPTDHQTDIRWHEVICITNEQKRNTNLTILLKIQCFPTEDWGSVCAGLSDFQITKTKQTYEGTQTNQHYC